MRVSIDAGLLQMVVNALKRDAAEGKVIRGEMVAEIEKDVQPLPVTKARHERPTPAYPISWAMGVQADIQDAFREVYLNGVKPLAGTHCGDKVAYFWKAVRRRDGFFYGLITYKEI